MNLKILETSEEYLEAINFIVDNNPKYVYVSTYGIYLGLSIDKNGERHDWHEKYPKELRNIVEKIISKDIECKIIVGDDEEKQRCVENCPHCIDNNKRLVERLMYHVEKFSTDKVKIVCKDNFHQKMFLTDKYFIIGGRNFTDSKYSDLSFLGNNKELLKELKEIFEKEYDNL